MWKSLKGLDAYPKTMEEFKVRTTQGGIISVVAIVLMVVLVISELNFHLMVDTVDKMYVDGERNVNLLINFDIDFPKMPCSIISVEHGDMQGRVHLDVIDNIHKIRLDTNGNSLGEMVKHEMGNALKEEHVKSHVDKGYYCGSCYAAGEPGDCCNTCDDVKKAYAIKNWAMPSMHSVSQVLLATPHISHAGSLRLMLTLVIQCMNDELEGILNGTVNEGCRIFGHLVVAKVAGKFYFAPSRIFENGYLLDKDMLDLTFRSFDNTHKIKTLTFGDEYPNMKNPLNSRNKTLPADQRGAYQYFLKVVSTDYTFLNGDEIKSNQYSVTEHFLQMTPAGHKGLPSVSFAYDFSPIKFRIEQTQSGLLPFFTSICAIVGGVFTVMGLVDSAMHQLSTKAIKKPTLL
ncbi:hypothetical protein, variant 1 [Aphanomyces invadans]|uniref:Endoplasmic reticulum-Golgi intermediate compartment protein 3 n=1 Tax=Aphanomyces invadans TaxID=157072 RepID=A0A024UX38_9STRA|nr:hypothetical protein, variant 1 [Aphanomyces invadans]ETW10243.1 hypothetical protein, variant 1 [Aphanomyces invadans]|eukprot:XP_008861654.1 hypothetical protein, variant 1 [Aphanomyces invadans]